MKAAAVANGEHIGRADMLFVKCRGPKNSNGHQPKNAGLYKEVEEKGSWKTLLKVKGLNGHDEYIWKFSTPDAAKYNKMRREHPNDILFIDRTKPPVVNQVPDITKFHYFRGLENHEMGRRSRQCWCEGCKGDGNCYHPEVSGIGKDIRQTMIRIWRDKRIEVKCFEKHRIKPKGGDPVNAPPKFEVKPVKRDLVDAAITTDANGVQTLVVTGTNANTNVVKPNSVVIFKEGGGENDERVTWTAGIVKGVMVGILLVDELHKDGATDGRKGVQVDFANVILASSMVPQSITFKIEINKDSSAELDALV